MKFILDPEFKYTPSFATDIRERFKKAKQLTAANDATHTPLPPAATGSAKRYPIIPLVRAYGS